MPPPVVPPLRQASQARLYESYSAKGTLTCDVPSPQEQLEELARPPRQRPLAEARAAHDKILSALLRRRGLRRQPSHGQPQGSTGADGASALRPAAGPGEATEVAASKRGPHSAQTAPRPPSPEPWPPLYAPGQGSHVSADATRQAPAQTPTLPLPRPSRQSSFPGQLQAGEHLPAHISPNADEADGAGDAAWPERYLAYQLKVAKRELEAAEERVKATQVPPQLLALLDDRRGEAYWAALPKLQLPEHCSGENPLHRLAPNDVIAPLMRGNHREQRFMCLRYHDLLRNRPGLVVLMQVQPGQVGTQDWTVLNPQRFGPIDLDEQSLEPRLLGLSYKQPERLPNAPAARKMLQALRTLVREGALLGRSSYVLQPTAEQLHEAALQSVYRRIGQARIRPSSPPDARRSPVARSPTPSAPLASPGLQGLARAADGPMLTGPLDLKDAPWTGEGDASTDDEDQGSSVETATSEQSRGSIALDGPGGRAGSPSPTTATRIPSPSRSSIMDASPDAHDCGPGGPRPPQAHAGDDRVTTPQRPARTGALKPLPASVARQQAAAQRRELLEAQGRTRKNRDAAPPVGGAAARPRGGHTAGRRAGAQPTPAPTRDSGPQRRAPHEAPRP